MKPRVRLENANIACQFANNHQKYGDIRSVASDIKTVLDQCANRAIVVSVKVVMMVLGNREQPCKQQCDNNDPE